MFKRFLKIFLPTLFALTFTAFGIYGAVQQSIRQGANSPQIQIAEDTDPAVFFPKEKVDIEKSLAPFVIIYDEDGKTLVSTGFINGVAPVPPTGVFDYTKIHGEDKVTWQTKDGVRIAAVLVYKNGNSPKFVLAGRNLREIEKTEDNIFKLIILGYFGFSCITFILSLFLAKTVATK